MPNCYVWQLLPWARKILFLEEFISLHHSPCRQLELMLITDIVYNFTLWGLQERPSLHMSRCSKTLFSRSTCYCHFDGNLLPDCSAANADHAYCCFGKKCGEIVAILGQEVAVVEEFVYLGSLVQSTTQSSPDISHCNAITHAVYRM